MSSKMVATGISLLLLWIFAAEATRSINLGSVHTSDVVDQGRSQRRALTQTPQNHAVLAGETVLLECSVDRPPPDSRIMWGEFITHTGGSMISDNELILDHPNRDRYRIVQNTPNDFYLEIRDVVLADGGKYVCQDTVSGPPNVFRGEAELIVIAANPNCTTTAPADGRLNEFQTYTAECIVNYQGLYAPTMSWTGPPEFQVGHSPPNPTGVWSGIQYVAHRSMDQGQYECLTNFSDIGNVPADVADNTPTWEYRYRDPKISISWGPRNIYAVPIKAEYAVGDSISCYADAHPPARFNWLNQRNFDLVYSQTINITSRMAGYTQILRCQAQNIIDGFVYEANYYVEVTVPAPTSPPTTPSTPPTTTQPAHAPCRDVTGHWLSQNPYAEMILEVDHNSEIGEIKGIMKNLTDTVWVEVVGSVRLGDFLYVGLTAIWPFQDGISGLAGECHRCHGTEVLMTESLWRSVAQSSNCGDGSTPAPDIAYRFNRVSSTTSMLQEEEFDVFNPTKEVSGRLGINLKKR